MAFGIAAAAVSGGKSSVRPSKTYAQAPTHDSAIGIAAAAKWWGRAVIKRSRQQHLQADPPNAYRRTHTMHAEGLQLKLSLYQSWSFRSLEYRDLINVGNWLCALELRYEHV
eukprot:1158063-Pelagomonas_calceolata.AAC.6